jgi:hypothetical protein
MTFQGRLFKEVAQQPTQKKADAEKADAEKGKVYIICEN